MNKLVNHDYQLSIHLCPCHPYTIQTGVLGDFKDRPRRSGGGGGGLADSPLRNSENIKAMTVQTLRVDSISEDVSFDVRIMR